MDLDQRLVISALLLLQAVLCQTQSKMIVPSQPIVVPVGSDVTLPCEVDPVKNLKDLVVEWARPDLKPRYIHIRRHGLDLLIDQNPQYQGRTQLWERGLQIGDMSLKLSRVRLSDGGTYRCFVPQMDTAGEVTLTVVSVSPVAVSLTKDHSGSPLLRCESRGWYPEPELLWLDSDGKNLSSGRTDVISSNDETFSVSSRLSVEQSPGNTFTCRVRQQQSRQSRETQITVTDEFLEVPSCSVAWTLFGLVLCLLLAAAVAFVEWKFKLLNKCFSNWGKSLRNEGTELGEMEEQERILRPEVKPQENTESLEVKVSEHKENLEKKQEELKFVETMINKLTETKEFLPKLKEKPQEVIHLLMSQVAVRKHLVKKKKLNTSHMRKECEESHKECEDQIKELEKQKETHVWTIVVMDEQIKAKEKMILEATQRKEQLEAQINNLTPGAQGENKPEVKPQANTQRLELSSQLRENLEEMQEELKVVVDVTTKLTETKDFLMKLKETPQEIIRLTNPQIDIKKIPDELKFVVGMINNLTETKDFLMTLKEKPQEIIILTNIHISVKGIQDALKCVVDEVKKMNVTQEFLLTLKEKPHEIIQLTNPQITVENMPDELNFDVDVIKKLTETKEFFTMKLKENPQEIINLPNAQMAKIHNDLTFVVDVITKLTMTTGFLMTLKQKPQEIINLTNFQLAVIPDELNVVDVIPKCVIIKEFLNMLKEKPLEIIDLTSIQMAAKNIPNELKVVVDVITKLGETKEFLMRLKEKPMEVIHLRNPQITVEKIQDELKFVVDVITKLTYTKVSLLKLEKKTQEIIRLADTQRIQDELKCVADEIIKLSETKESLIKLKKKDQEIIDQLDCQIAVWRNTSHTFLTFLKDVNKEEDEELEHIRELERPKDLCREVIQETDKPLKSIEMIILEATQRKGRLERDLETETKLMDNVKRRLEAAVGPELQKISHDVKVNVPMATGIDLDQTPGAES